MLLKGQSLVIERPPRTAGTAVGAVIALVSAVLAAALIVRALGWPVSFTQFMAYALAGVLFAVAAAFAFWAYSCATMRYVMDRSGLSIRWGLIRHFISIEQIEGTEYGRGEHRIRVGGVGWWGYHVGPGYVEEFGRVLFFSTHRSPEELVYVRTPEVTYGITPQNPIRFVAEAQRFQEAAKPGSASSVKRAVIAAHPLWSDRVAQLLGLGAVALNASLWGYVFAMYPGLDAQITIEFPPIGEITRVASRSEIFKIPGTATAILGMNLLVGLAFQWRERVATYLLLSGAAFFQVLFWIGAFVAVSKA